jgi:hypothetical protein
VTGDLIFPTDNGLEVPALIPSLQASALDAPLVQWGARSRQGSMRGTWAFYVDDYRFAQLWTKPSLPLLSSPAGCVEPNFSVFDQTPFPVALWATYRKRWLARYWQSQGVPVWVDLNVSETHSLLNLVGVPRGWSAYATRGYDDRLQALGAELERATEHGNGVATLLVYGGGEAVAEWARAQGSRCIHVRSDTAPRLFTRGSNGEG